jgi:hypothetical protein
MPTCPSRAGVTYFCPPGRSPVLDKTCINTLRVGYLHNVPAGEVVFIHRDGRATSAR